MATTTTNYGLKKPDTNDFYNIADFNGNADIIDTNLKEIGDRAAYAALYVSDAISKTADLYSKATYTMTCTKSGKVYTLSNVGYSSGLVSCLFKAPADYAAGDSFKVGSTPYAVVTSNGEELGDKAFVSGAVVSVVLDHSGKTINFKQAERKLTLSADSYVMVQCFTENGTFTAPMTGKYRITCIGKGGDGDNTNYDPLSYVLNGAGGGAGGAASGILSMTKGDSFIITVDSGVSSFGALMSATAGQKGQFAANEGGNTAIIAGGAAGVVSRNAMADAITYTGQPGERGEMANVGASSYDDSYGGDGGAYTSGQCKFLPTVGGKGGYYQYDSSLGHSTAYYEGLPPDGFSPSGLAPFGAGGGGAMFFDGWRYKGGHGGSGAVIIELVLD